jgi:heme-degrading monooxygenase HmoA
MPYILVRHKVEDWAKWKPIYDENGATRKAAGCQRTHVFRNDQDPNEVVILLEWDDLGRARQFAESEDLRQTMQRAGVTDQPDVYFLNDAGRTSE